MTLQSRIQSLKARHAGLELRISDEDHRPQPDSGTLARLKLEKLRLKEELERLRASENSVNGSSPGRRLNGNATH
jgi:hypothetical protein